jgi:pyruvate/2-oxoglutarate dehydrogenase complex dihydrolipoamide dehydrogenase (E3) component
MTTTHIFDVVAIGAGPVGENAADRVATLRGIRARRDPGAEVECCS